MDIKKVLSIYWKFIRPYLRYQVFIVFLIVLSSFVTLCLPYLFKIIIDELTTAKSISLLLRSVFRFVVFYVLQSLFQILRAERLSYIRNRLDYDLTLRLLKSILHFDVHFFQEIKVGELIHRVMNEVTEVKTIFSDLFINVITQTINFFIVLLIMLKLTSNLTFLVLAAVPLIIIHTVCFSPKFKRVQAEITTEASTLTNGLQDYLQGIDVIKSNRKEDYALLLLSRNLHSLISAFGRAVYLQVVNGQIMSIINLIVFFLVLIFGGIDVIQGRMSIGSFVAIYTYISKLYDPVRSIVETNIRLQGAFVSLERYVDLIERPIANRNGICNASILKKGIMVKNVTYVYPDGEIGIDNISFELYKGEIIALTGENGTGKSTILNVLQGIYSPTTGVVLIDNIPLSSITSSGLKQMIGYVSQSSYLFNTTIERNVFLGRRFNKHIEKLARVLNIHDYILSLENGYQTLVEKNGEDFSGGQKQKITILRALCNDPSIILLDESTSAIDNKSEQSFFEYLQSIKKDKLIVFVTHDRKLLKYADRVIELVGHQKYEKRAEIESLPCNSIW